MPIFSVGRVLVVGAVLALSVSGVSATAHASTVRMSPSAIHGDELRMDIGSPITLNLVQVPLRQALQMIATAGQFTLCYEVGQTSLPLMQKVNLRIQNASAEEALRSVLLGSGYGIQIRANGVVMIVEDSLNPTDSRNTSQRCFGVPQSTPRRDS